MAFGILEPTGAASVPGTTLLDDHALPAIAGQQGLKTATGKHSHIILVPQPSDDPNDPLNWPLWQRDLVFTLWCACSLAIVGGFGPILSPMTVPLIMEFHISFTQVSQLTGYALLSTACIGIFISAFCRKFGKRGPLLFSVSCAFAGALWAGAAESYGSLLGARILQGCGVSIFEAITFVVVADLYFVHQRGNRTAAYVACLSALGNIPVIAAGKTTDNLGWRWVFWLLALFIGILWLLCILFGWETTYTRRSQVVLSNNQEMTETDEPSKIVEVKRVEHAEQLSASEQALQRRGLWKRMSLYSGVFTDESVSSMIVKPFLICVHPAVIWAFLTLAFPVLWTVGISLVTAQIFSAPPYLFTSTQLGYISVGAVVGGLLACLLCGWLSDYVARRLALSNGGVYEPEFRLVLVIGLAILSALGYFLFGNLVTEGKSAVGMAALYGAIVAGNQFAAVCVGTYMVDAFPDINVETFIITMIAKNFLFFAFTFFVNDWLVSWGPARMFDCIGGIQLGLCLLTLPLWIFGKKIRLWWASTHFMRIIL